MSFRRQQPPIEPARVVPQSAVAAANPDELFSRTHANPEAIAAVVAVTLAVHLFVVFYEEPTLRRKFGADYE